jgi:hypothetical protein
MPDTCIPLKQGEVVFGERLRNKSHFGMHPYSGAIGYGDACAFLTAVLQSKKGKKDGMSAVYPGSIDSKNAAAFSHARLPDSGILDYL